MAPKYQIDPELGEINVGTPPAPADEPAPMYGHPDTELGWIDLPPPEVTPPPKARPAGVGGRPLTPPPESDTGPTFSGVGSAAGATGAAKLLSDPGIAGDAIAAFAGKDGILSRDLFPDREGTLTDIEEAGPLQEMWPELREAILGAIQNNPLTQAREQFLRDKPTLAGDPGLDPYFEDAARTTQERIDRAMASRGAYGSSAAGDYISEAMTELGAQQAGLEAEYHLKRTAEQRAWEALGLEGAAAESDAIAEWVRTGGVVSGATEGIEFEKDLATFEAETGMNSQELMQANQAVQLALGVDAGEANRLMSAVQMGAISQGLDMQQTNMLFKHMLAPITMLADIAGSTYGSMLMGDDALLSSIIGMDLGWMQQQLNMSSQEFNNFIQTIAATGDVIGNLAGLGVDMPLTPQQIAQFITPWESSGPAWGRLQKSIRGWTEGAREDRKQGEVERHNRAQEEQFKAQLAAQAARAQQKQEQEVEKAQTAAVEKALPLMQDPATMPLAQQVLAAAGVEFDDITPEPVKPVSPLSAGIIRRVTPEGEAPSTLVEGSKEQIIAQAQADIAAAAGDVPGFEAPAVAPPPAQWELTEDAVRYGFTEDRIKEILDLTRNPQKRQAHMAILEKGGLDETQIAMMGGKLPPPVQPEPPEKTYRFKTAASKFELQPRVIMRNRAQGLTEVLEARKDSGEILYEEIYDRAIKSIPEALRNNAYDAAKAMSSIQKQINKEVDRDIGLRKSKMNIDAVTKRMTNRAEMESAKIARQMVHKEMDDKVRGYKAIVQKLDFVSSAIKMLDNDTNAADHNKAVFLVARLYDSGRLSNQDIERLGGGGGLLGRFLNWLSDKGVAGTTGREAEGGTLTEDAKGWVRKHIGSQYSRQVRDVMIESLQDETARLMERGRGIYDRFLVYRGRYNSPAAKAEFTRGAGIIHDEEIITGLEDPGEVLSEVPTTFESTYERKVRVRKGDRGRGAKSKEGLTPSEQSQLNDLNNALGGGDG